MKIARKILTATVTLISLSLLANTAWATSGECPRTTAVNYFSINDNKSGFQELDLIRDNLKTLQNQDPVVKAISNGEGLLLPVAAAVEQTEPLEKVNIKRIAYGIKIKDKSYVLSSEISDSVAKNTTIFEVKQKRDNLENSIVVSTNETLKKIGNCAPHERWNCTKQKSRSCFETKCARCTYFVNWKAVLACAVILCPYVMNYTCCAAGKCVPRMYS